MLFKPDGECVSLVTSAAFVSTANVSAQLLSLSGIHVEAPAVECHI